VIGEAIGFSAQALKYNSAYEIDSRLLRIDEVRGCIVVPAKKTSQGSSLSEMQGGVYDCLGNFVEASAQTRSEGRSAVQAYQTQLDLPEAGIRLVEAVYGGIILDHFGHFLLETTSRLWALTQLPRNLPWIFLIPLGVSLKQYQIRLLAKIGLSSSRIIIVDQPIAIDKLHIPASGISYHHWVSKYYLAPFQNSPGTGTKRFSGRIYLSRSHLHGGFTVGERELEDYIQNHGWRVLKTDLLSFEDQISLFRSDNMIMGLQGSALHMCLFSRPRSDVVHLCRSAGQRAYYMLDNLSGVKATYLYSAKESSDFPSFGSSGPYLLDLDLTAAFLRNRGLLNSRLGFTKKLSFDAAKLERMRQAWWHYEISNRFKYEKFPNISKSESQQKSVEHSKEAVAIDPENVLFRQQLISCTQSFSGSLAAREEIQKAIVAYPCVAAFHHMKAGLDDAEGRYQDALASSSAAHELEPNNHLYTLQHALQLYRADNIDDARALLLPLEQTELLEAKDHHLISLIEEKKNLPDWALRAARKAAALSKNNLELATRVIQLLLKQRKFAEAAVEACFFSRAFPRLNKFEEFECIIRSELLKEAVPNTASPEVLYEVSLILHQAGCDAQALRLVQLAVDKRPDNWDMVAHLINMQFKLDQAEDAKRTARSAIAEGANNVVLFHLFSVLLYREASYPDALEASEKALALAPTNQWVISHNSTIRKAINLEADRSR
jgi:capsular polysaccharide biosynthesis protein